MIVEEMENKTQIDNVGKSAENDRKTLPRTPANIAHLKDKELQEDKTKKVGGKILAPTTPQSQEYQGISSYDGKKRCHFSSEDSSVPTTVTLSSLPRETLWLVFESISEAKDLCSLACMSKHFREIVDSAEDRWQNYFIQSFGAPTEITKRASSLAGSWKKLYESRHVRNRKSMPWQVASPFEIEAAIDYMMLHRHEFVQQPSISKGRAYEVEPTTIIFLVDGSGSVTEDDFECMMNLIRSYCMQVATKYRIRDSDSASDVDYEIPRTHSVGIIQFSNIVRVELKLSELTSSSFDSERSIEQVIQGIHRINGGTNIAAAIQQAANMVHARQYSSRSILVLLTDGRIDSYQAREAGDVLSRLKNSRDTGHVCLQCFGVGRGVDSHEILRIISPDNPQKSVEHYLPLQELPDSLW